MSNKKKDRARQSRQSQGVARRTAATNNPQPDGREHGNSSQQVTTFQSRTEFFAGPLPPPEILARYDVVVPGSAERIINLFVQQANHRMSLETVVIQGDSRRADWGVVAGFALTVMILAISLYLITRGYVWPGISFASLDLVGLIGVFIYGTNSRRRERQNKAERTK